MAMPHDSGMALHMRMMQDPVIRQRVMADTAMHRMMMQMMQHMPAEHREHMMQMLHPTPSDSAHAGHGAAVPVSKEAAPRRALPSQPAASKQPARRPTATRPPSKPAAKPATDPAPRPAPKPADPHAGHRPPRR
jgi:hypothetical protein